MDKAHAIDMLGGTVKSAADAIGVTRQAVNKWPDKLPPRIADRVLAAYVRMKHKAPQKPVEVDVVIRGDGNVVLDERDPANAKLYIAPKRRHDDPQPTYLPVEE